MAAVLIFVRGLGCFVATIVMWPFERHDPIDYPPAAWTDGT